MSRSRIGKLAPDLRSHCPICGNPYRPGEAVLALAGLSFARSAAVPSSPAAESRDPGTPIIVGHHECVLPRLLTLLASFQPAARFVTPSDEGPAPEARFLECCRDAP